MSDEYYSSRNSALRVWLNSVDDDHKDKVQYAEAEGLYGEKWKQVIRVQPHGFSSVPPKDSHAFAIALGGKRDALAIFGGEHPDHKPKKLGAGNSAFYNADGTIMKMIGKDSSLEQEGEHVHKCKSITIKCGDTTLTLTKDGLHLKGGYLKHDDHKIDSTHKHTNSGGTGTGGPPE